MVIPHLAFELTTIPRPSNPPTRLALIPPRAGNQVEIPFMDHRLATCTLDMDPAPGTPHYDEQVKAIAALMDLANNRDMTMRVALKARYVAPSAWGANGNPTAWTKQLAFWGPVRRPQWDYDQGIVTLAAVAPTARIEKAFVVSGDIAITPGIRLDGHGLRNLLAMAQNRPNQDALNWPSLGIVPGLDTATSSSVYATLQRFDNIWSQGFVTLGEAIICPDFDVEPIETDPSAIATGAVTDATDHVLSSGVNNLTLTSTLPGLIGKLRLGIYLAATRPGQVKIELKHPDGTWTTLWDGSNTADTTISGAMLGQGSASDSDLCFLADKGNPLYGSNLVPITYPRVGQFFAIDGPPTAALFEKNATGAYTLKITVSAGTATLHYASLRFETPEPAYARLNTMDKPNTDAPVIAAVFHSGFGKHNLKTFRVATEGGLLVNEDIEVPQVQNPNPVVRENGASRSETGTWQDCQSSGQNDSAAVLEAKGDAKVKAYGRPPVTPEDFQPADDIGQPGLPRLLFDYKVGDHLRAVGKRGGCRHDVILRAMRGTLTQLAGGVETTLDLLPTVSASSELGAGDAA